MPNQVVPISNLTQVGLVEDTPSVSLPPNAFSDVQNIRFHDGAVRKQPGETDLLDASSGSSSFPGLDNGSNVDYVAYWPAPSSRRVVVVSGTNLLVYDIQSNGSYARTMVGSTPMGGTIASTTELWQHTLFNGGYHIILNNGSSTPIFLQDDVADVQELPGWDSYAVETTRMDFEYDGSPTQAQAVNVVLEAGSRIKVTNIPRNTSVAIRSETVTVNSTVNGVTPDGTLTDIGTISNVSSSGFSFTPNNGLGGNRFVISTVSAPAATVTAGVIRAYGNLLVAGNLMERDSSNNVLRTLTGTIRTSDVAGPGQIPESWNPFMLGANTADEFILASTGTITDMAELQGILYVYTDSSIHSIQQTGSPVLPFQIAPVTDNYGAHNTNSVLEFDGKHIVYGSNDVYVFAGHPGSISSIVDGKVRDAFRDDANYRVVRYNSQDEIWFWRSQTGTNSTLIYIWNYRLNVWTKRVRSDLDTTRYYRTVESLPRGMLLLNLEEADSDSIISVLDESSYLPNSFVERRRLAVSPEFDTETLVSMAILVDGSGTLSIEAVGSNAPGEDVDPTTAPDTAFDIATDYKQDLRVHGRFLNYRITHAAASEMNLTGMQFDIGKGGRR